MSLNGQEKPTSVMPSGPEIEIGEPFVAEDGTLTQAIKSTFSDGFVCLRFVEVDVKPELESDTTGSGEIPTF